MPEQLKDTAPRLNYETALSAIGSLKKDLGARNEATHLFGQERDGGLDSILNNIEQTFGGEPLYKTPDKKAAHPLYTFEIIMMQYASRKMHHQSIFNTVF